MKKDIFESMYDACLLEFQEYAESLLGFEYSQLVLEATDNGRQLILEQLDEERFIKANDCKEITNPVMFQRGNTPTPDGLLSYDIFGVTMEERAGIFAYIDLGEKFIQPFFYKVWLKLDKNLRACIYETDNFRIDENGYLVPDPNGQTGLNFLIENEKRVQFKNTKKDDLLKALLRGKEDSLLFTSKLIVIPPFYRDVDTGSGGKIGVGEINKLYIALLNSVRALKETSIYGLDISGGIKGRIQEILTQIYNWFTVGESTIGGEHTGSGIIKKFGIMRRAVINKTTDNAARLVLSAPKINVERKEDLMVNMDYCSAPLAAVLVAAYPFIIHHLNRFFQNQFGGLNKFNAYDKETDSIKTIELVDPLIEFSNDRLDAELNEYIHGYSNRFKPILVKAKDGKTYPIQLKGYVVKPDDYKRGVRESGNILERDMTWLDLFYICASESVKDKMALITRLGTVLYIWQHG